MPVFFTGDKVRCIGMSDEYSTTLEVGKIYTVSNVYPDNGWLEVEEDDECGEYEGRYFEHVDPTLNERVDESVPACIMDLVKTVPRRKAKDVPRK